MPEATPEVINFAEPRLYRPEGVPAGAGIPEVRHVVLTEGAKRNWAQVIWEGQDGDQGSWRKRIGEVTEGLKLMALTLARKGEDGKWRARRPGFAVAMARVAETSQEQTSVNLFEHGCVVFPNLIEGKIVAIDKKGVFTLKRKGGKGAWGEVLRSTLDKVGNQATNFVIDNDVQEASLRQLNGRSGIVVESVPDDQWQTVLGQASREAEANPFISTEDWKLHVDSWRREQAQKAAKNKRQPDPVKAGDIKF